MPNKDLQLFSRIDCSLLIPSPSAPFLFGAEFRFVGNVTERTKARNWQKLQVLSRSR